MEEKEYLVGGRAQQIYKIGDKVIRPANRWTKDLHRFLHHLTKSGANFVPKPEGVNDKGEEIIAFMPGEVYNDPLPEMFFKDSMIISAAKLLASYHLYSKEYVKFLNGSEPWMLKPVFPIEVLCHGDFAPYNVTILQEQAANIIDFDTVHPGPRMWDIVYAIYRWIPLSDPSREEHPLDLNSQIKKSKLFLDTYGVSIKERENLCTLLVKRLETLMEYMISEAEMGNEDFKKHIQAGHLEVYRTDIQYLKRHEKQILKGIQK